LDFGEPGRGHVRLNVATSAEILGDILGRLGGALGWTAWSNRGRLPRWFSTGR